MKVIVRKRQAKDLLSKSKLGDYTINPYIGCPHKCLYCYASFMKKYTNHSEPWGDFLDIKECNKPIDLKKIKGKNIFMSSVTDCYNPYEYKYEKTREILKQLIGIDCYLEITTKNKLILRDLDLLKQMKHLTVAVSINTLDEYFKNDMDRASSIKERLNVLKTIHNHNIRTILFMSPIFPLITDYKTIIEISKNYVDEYWFEDLNLRGDYKYQVLSYIRNSYKDLYPIYEEIFLKGIKDRIRVLEKEIMEYCDKNKIKYRNYFHHSDRMKQEVN